MTLDPMLQDLVETFFAEAKELCERAAGDVLALERAAEGGPAVGKHYQSLKRSLHTLKGSSATLELTDVAEIAHAMEDGVAPLGEALLPVPKPVADELLAALDQVVARARAHADGRGASLPDAAAIARRVRAIASGSPRAGEETPGQAPDATTNGDAPELLDAGEAADWRIGREDVALLVRETERLREIHLKLEERHRALARGLALLERAAATVEGHRARRQLGDVERALRSDAEEIGDVVGALEEHARSIGTLPLATLLGPLHRAVRDVARATGKEVSLSVSGGEISLDRRVVDRLRGPLIHLVRNAVDHGIEAPAAREARGKSREGRLSIRAEQQGNLVSIEVADDGAGIDEQRVAAIARDRGLCSAEELGRMGRAELHRLVFRPGFSTKAAATETSGRGVGLDVVRTEVERLSGRIEIESALGQGARFVLLLPVEFGGSPTLVVRCGETRVGVPMLAVESVASTRPADLRADGGGTGLLRGEALLPLRDLGALLGLRQPDAPEAGQPLLVVRLRRDRVALAVDEVIGGLDLVIRPLPRELAGLPVYRGAATLARGELLPVLRVEWLVAAAQQVAIAPALGGRRALVVDDSLATRALHRTILEAGGYIVHGVGSARQALEQLRSSRYDVVVSDVAMEGMDGLSLTVALRGRPEGRDLAILLVSAQEGEPIRRRALDAGADAFVSKRDCARGRLLAEVATVLARRSRAA